MQSQLGLLLGIGLFSTFVQADVIQPALDKIDFQVTAKQWVTTKSALLTVNANMTLSNADLVKARADIMSSLKKIAPGDWHLLSFDRSQDSSGLEKLFVQAQARIDQGALTSIYSNAKEVSKPGAQYAINAVDFKPSLEETQAVLVAVREKLYQQISDELARINKAYPLQRYSVNQVVFVDGETPVPPPVNYQAKAMNSMTMLRVPAAASLTVSNELTLTAMVEVASNRKQGD